MAEDSERYSVLLVGVGAIEGGEEAAVTKLSERFKLKPAVAERLVAAIPAVVKKDVSRAHAEKYASALRELGAEARVVPLSREAEERAAVTGILKQRRERRKGTGSTDTVRTSGGYMSVKKRGGSESADAALRSDTPAGVPHALHRQQDSDGADVVVIDDGAPDAFALPPGLGGDGPVGGPTLVADGPSIGGSTQRFDPGAFALPTGVTGTTGQHDAVSADPAEKKHEPNFDLDDVGPGRASARPSLYDELMAMGSDSTASFMAGGPPPIDDDLPGVQDVRPPTDEWGAAKGEEESTRRLNDAGGLSDYGALNLGDSAEASALELDTDKPHLTGPYGAITGSGSQRRVSSAPHAIARSGSSGTNATVRRASSGASVVDEEPWDEPAPPSGANRAVRVDARLVRDPLAAEIERTLSESGTSPRRAGPGAGAPRVTGGFDATTERVRRTNQRWVRRVVQIIALAGLVVAGFYGWTEYQAWSAAQQSNRFVNAPRYFEQHVQLDGAEGVRGCAGDASEDGFVCRYSTHWYAEWFPDLPAEVRDAASASCFSDLMEDGTTRTERIDCRVASGTPGEKVRLVVLRERRCDGPILSAEPGATIDCREGETALVLGPDAADPGVDLGPPMPFVFRREVALRTDVGELATREYLVTPPHGDPEYRYFAPSVGLFARTAPLARPATVRLTYEEQGGRSAGTQVWPR